jgi:hypothetical protein
MFMDFQYLKKQEKIFRKLIWDFPHNTNPLVNIFHFHDAIKMYFFCNLLSC